jgi:hypothetical protein
MCFKRCPRFFAAFQRDLLWIQTLAMPLYLSQTTTTQRNTKNSLLGIRALVKTAHFVVAIRQI